MKQDSVGKTREWDHGTRKEFLDYYAQESLGTRPANGLRESATKSCASFKRDAATRSVPF